MDTIFSLEFKELVAQSRNIAIDLGYDYISTIHFFLADCESKRTDSIFNFCFKDELEYQTFKKHHTLEKQGDIELINDSLLLTKEAEITIRISVTEKKLQGDDSVLPRHLFVSALKNKDSALFESFVEETNALEKLIEYYKIFEQTNSTKTDGQERINPKVIRVEIEKLNLIGKIKKTLGLTK